MSDVTERAWVSGAGRQGLSDAERAIGSTVAALLDASMDRPPVAPRAWFAGHLGVSETDCESLAETDVGFGATDLLLALGELLRRCPPDALAAADRDDADVTWMRMPGVDERLPTGFRAVWRTLPRGETPLGVMVRVGGEQECTLWVYAREEAVEQGRRELDKLLRGLMVDAKPPFHGQVVTVDFSRAGERLTPVVLPELSRADLILPRGVWDAVDREVHGVLDKAPLLERLGLGLDRGVLFHGRPGTGKTELVRTIAHEAQGQATVLMPSPAVARDRLERVYTLAQRLRPAIVVLEDLDLLLDRRHPGSNLASFLAAVDGSTTEHVGVITIATTNDIAVLDEAVLRSSRLDRHIEVPLPRDDARHAILQRLLAPLDRTFELEQLVAATAGMSGADLRELIRTAVLADTLHASGLRELAHSRRINPVTAGHYL